MSQSTVRDNIASGIIGERRDNSPHRALPYILNSADAANNVFGRAFTLDVEGKAKAGGAGGVFVGILIDPKEHALAGTTAGGAYAPSLTLPNGDTAAFLTMGLVNVLAPATGLTIGTAVYYVDATGVLGFGTAAGGQTQILNASVWEYDPTLGNIAVIRLTN